MKESDKQRRLDHLKNKLVAKIGPKEALDIRTWFQAVKNGDCPNCGLTFPGQPDQLNIYPHFIGSCKP